MVRPSAVGAVEVGAGHTTAPQDPGDAGHARGAVLVADAVLLQGRERNTKGRHF